MTLKVEYLDKPILCLKCKKDAHQKIVRSCKINAFDKPTNNSYVEMEVFAQILVCLDCKTPSLRTFESRKRQNEVENEKFQPLRKDKTGIENIEDLIEKTVYNRYLESIDAYNNSMNFSSGAAIRSVLELICDDRKHKQHILDKITKKYCDEECKQEDELTEQEKDDLERLVKLSAQVERLKKEIKRINPLFDSKDVGILDVVVHWGNDNIHKNIQFDDSDLLNAFRIIENVFKVLYIEPDQKHKMLKEFRDSADNLKTSADERKNKRK